MLEPVIAAVIAIIVGLVVGFAVSRFASNSSSQKAANEAADLKKKASQEADALVDDAHPRHAGHRLDAPARPFAHGSILPSFRGSVGRCPLLRALPSREAARQTGSAARSSGSVSATAAAQCQGLPSMSGSGDLTAAPSPCSCTRSGTWAR